MTERHLQILQRVKERLEVTGLSDCDGGSADCRCWACRSVRQLDTVMAEVEGLVPVLSPSEVKLLEMASGVASGNLGCRWHAVDVAENLRDRGYMRYKAAGLYQITDEGRAALDRAPKGEG